MPKLTIGMATYDDFDGCWFTLQALRLYHDLRDVELLVVDNKPDAPGSAELRQKVEGWMRPLTAGTRYVAAPQVVGTSAPRDMVFRLAVGDAVLCIDSHVLLAPGAVAKLIAWYDEHPRCGDLVQGPLSLDHLTGVQTHFIDYWRGEMWGIWARPGKSARAATEYPSSRARARRGSSRWWKGLPLSSSAACGVELPDVPYAGHERVLESLGCRQLGLDDADAFEIPGQGLGLFSCRRDAWPGFNEHFRGFGGEEMYLHEKFRQRGDKCLCLGFLKWLHKFGRPGGVKYPLTRWNKVRNYVLGHRELGLATDRVHEHFVTSGLMTERQWDYLARDPVRHVTEPPPALPDTVDEIYDAVRPPLARRRDLDEHMPQLVELAEKCEHVTEFSKRRESFIAFAQARQATVVSHNTEFRDPLVEQLLRIENGQRLLIDGLSSPGVADIDETDLLFIDSQHTAVRLREELAKFAPRVRHYIVLHDTAVHGQRGEDGGEGLASAVRDFCESSSEWFIATHTLKQYGLTVLSRLEADRPEHRFFFGRRKRGPGRNSRRCSRRLASNRDRRATADPRRTKWTSGESPVVGSIATQSSAGCAKGRAAGVGKIGLPPLPRPCKLGWHSSSTHLIRFRD